MAEQNRLDLGRRNLHPLVLDQFLQTIDDEEAAVGVDVPEIALVQPSVVLDHRAGRRRASSRSPFMTCGPRTQIHPPASARARRR